MGGLAGRADALFGAVGCQKFTGSLHYHFFVFIQRLDQFASMKEIAELLEAKMVQATELKDFLANICCESYSDLEQHIADLTPLESNFPTYSERTECGSPEKPLWGNVKLGRLPAFLYADYRSHSVQDSANPRAGHRPSTSIDPMDV